MHIFYISIYPYFWEKLNFNMSNNDMSNIMDKMMLCISPNHLFLNYFLSILPRYRIYSDISKF